MAEKLCNLVKNNQFSQIAILEGTLTSTMDSYTYVDLPTGFTRDNVYVLSLKCGDSAIPNEWSFMPYSTYSYINTYGTQIGIYVASDRIKGQPFKLVIGRF